MTVQVTSPDISGDLKKYQAQKTKKSASDSDMDQAICKMIETATPKTTTQTLDVIVDDAGEYHVQFNDAFANADVGLCVHRRDAGPDGGTQMMKQRCKTLPARVLAVVLSLVMLLGSLPVSAAESRFLSFQVESVSENGSKTESREAAYVVGQELYVSTNFLAKYTLFYYNGDTHAFVLQRARGKQQVR